MCVHNVTGHLEGLGCRPAALPLLSRLRTAGRDSPDADDGLLYGGTVAHLPESVAACMPASFVYNSFCCWEGVSGGRRVRHMHVCVTYTARIALCMYDAGVRDPVRPYACASFLASGGVG
jgi:hypothetical protein